MVNISFIFYTIYTIFVISPLAGGISVAIFILSGIVGTLANFWMREKRNLRRDAYKEALHNLTIMIMSRNELLQNETLYEKCLEKICLFLSRA